ncbi:myosin light chain 1, skeletal muscle isoform [Pieris rapae]|uniref:myosin light chain 1, skeletal muscle isoform n=1 Tax=Pieris rapae TaxID=64459 RepID=UPI001E27B3E5|nr:myosin light chain 1, skeletal muscle isoform [Pieris rapae]
MPKKGKGKEPAPAKAAAPGPPPKPKKIPPPPACFGPEDLAKFKELFKACDEENIDKVKIEQIPFMLRKLGFNPKSHEIKELFKLFLEDDLVDTVEYHEFLFMIEAKMNWGDDFELAVTKAMAALAHDDEQEIGIADFETLREELTVWGEPLTEIEFVDWIKLSVKDKTYNMEDGTLNYVKFIENMNAKDVKYIKEPINFYKLDQKTLAAMAIKKAQEEKEEQEKKDALNKAREEAKRQKMIADGLIPPD